ncbi:MAG: DUF4190 domain-containing protein [Saprospirales bacterium]|nr:DUF4190 domain-containing protein [Saprospirales bacterium]
MKPILFSLALLCFFLSSFPMQGVIMVVEPAKNSLQKGAGQPAAHLAPTTTMDQVPKKAKKFNNLALSSFVVGIIAIAMVIPAILGWFFFEAALAIGIFGAVLSVIALVKGRKKRLRGNFLAIFGLLLSVFSSAFLIWLYFEFI